MKPRTISAYLLLTLALAAAAFAAQPTSGYVVAGKVVNSVTGQALPDMAVTLAPDRSGGASQTVQSSGEGRFQFPPTVSGKYLLSASGTGFSL